MSLKKISAVQHSKATFMPLEFFVQLDFFFIWSKFLAFMKQRNKYERHDITNIRGHNNLFGLKNHKAQESKSKVVTKFR